jgi:hypothetical protein
MVSDDRFGRDVRTGQGLTKKRFRTCPIPVVPQEHINDLPLPINRTIQVEFLLATKAEHFVDGPFLPHSPSMLMERGGKLRTKRLHPIQHRACGDIKVTLS